VYIEGLMRVRDSRGVVMRSLVVALCAVSLLGFSACAHQPGGPSQQRQASTASYSHLTGLPPMPYKDMPSIYMESGGSEKASAMAHAE